eukprot:3066792-Amphidinium_carterae.1
MHLSSQDKQTCRLRQHMVRMDPAAELRIGAGGCCETLKRYPEANWCQTQASRLGRGSGRGLPLTGLLNML